MDANQTRNNLNDHCVLYKLIIEINYCMHLDDFSKLSNFYDSFVKLL